MVNNEKKVGWATSNVLSFNIFAYISFNKEGNFIGGGVIQLLERCACMPLPRVQILISPLVKIYLQLSQFQLHHAL